MGQSDSQGLHDSGLDQSAERLPVKTIPSCTCIDPDDLAPRVSGTVMDYEQYPVIGRNPPMITV
jgi:hypothetical protein